MSLRKLKHRLRYYLQYFPFTLNTLLCAIAIFITYKLLYKPLPKSSEDPAPFLPFILLMAKMAFYFIISLILFSVITTLASWSYYLWLKNKKNIKLQVQFHADDKQISKHRLYLEALLEGVRRPFLGFVKGRLFYDDFEMTDRFSLLSNKRKEKSIWRMGIIGKNKMILPDIKEYELKGGFVFFEDMLQLFSLAVAQPIHGHFYQPPTLQHEEETDVFPKKTETMDVRIDQMRRVEGEYLNYKNFEIGDDIRRIVWKVYAKNRDLVVRRPEMFEPYASHLYFYASFFSSVKSSWLDDGYLKEMLNYYKNNVWTILDTLSQKEWAMRYIPDQHFNIPEQLSISERSARMISNSNWQKNVPLSQYFEPKKGAVLCISSFTDKDELQNMLEQCDASTVVYLIKCSQIFEHNIPWNWLKRLIFLPPKNRLNKLRSKWVFSPMSIQIRNREKALEAILKKSVVISGVL